jgi:lincosamide nucleotidyltransferase A/C/D/E
VLRALYRLVERSPARQLLRLPALERARRRATATSMSEADVIAIVHLLMASGISAWLCGGWACDALLGEQTRPHADLDVVVSKVDRVAAVHILEQHGFVRFSAFDGALLTSVIELVDRRHRLSVGLHFVDIGADRPEGWQAALGAAVAAIGLHSDPLFVRGAIAGHELPCLSAPALLALRTGYEPGEADHQDVQRLCARFGLASPPGYNLPRFASSPDAG